MIRTDVRYIRPTEDSYTCKNKSGSKESRHMCLHCSSNASCNVANTLKSGDQIKMCSHYQYPIAFRSLKGTEGLFNTMRMGKAWSGRLLGGETIGLLNKDGELEARAKVRTVLLLPRKEALDLHARFNHMMINEDPIDASQRLAKVLRNVYGKIVWERETHITVIYASRVS